MVTAYVADFQILIGELRNIHNIELLNNTFHGALIRLTTVQFKKSNGSTLHYVMTNLMMKLQFIEKKSVTVKDYAFSDLFHVHKSLKLRIYNLSIE